MASMNIMIPAGFLTRVDFKGGFGVSPRMPSKKGAVSGYLTMLPRPKFAPIQQFQLSGMVTAAEKGGLSRLPPGHLRSTLVQTVVSLNCTPCCTNLAT